MAAQAGGASRGEEEQEGNRALARSARRNRRVKASAPMACGTVSFLFVRASILPRLPQSTDVSLRLVGDCSPRLPAQRFQVKKDSPNRGKWFYTCQKTGDKKCGFFLWEEDARKAAEGNTFSSSSVATTTTPAKPLPGPSTYVPQPRNLWEDDNEDVFSTPRPAKRARNEFEEDTQDEFGWDFSPEEIRQLKDAVDTPMKPPPVTPAKSAPSPETFKTPMSKRRTLPWMKDQPAYGLRTPSTSSTIGNSFVAAETLRNSARETSPTLAYGKAPKFSSQESAPSSQSTITSSPTAARSRLDFQPAENQEADLVLEVMELLEAEHVLLANDSRPKLLDVLKKHSLRAQGALRGRDVARASLKARDTKVAELQHRIATLEAELEEKKAIIEHVTWERENSAVS